ncbi:hypothetical protein Cch01nite_03150 [Cellulomonas chitinilytica]|uniref:Uncharacterized protein n=1 Tax=Cellulomonas chitinilytica TaxID=398759 RepID=A0A919P0V4_9CELL|nr:hypothetical protein [Cellulomonas chitinilytica]GIG19591.1 hypothetical protein Cch01nite_03150 [Cellulomonas chitinilytica]
MTDVGSGAHAVVLRGGSELTAPGSPAAVSTESVAFDRRPVSWDDLPSDLRDRTTRATAFVGECAGLDAELDVADGLPVQVCRAWRAYRDVVFVAEVVRSVAPGPRGGVEAVGPWRERALAAYAVRGVPDRRVGSVDAEVAEPGSEGQVRMTQPAPVPSAHAEAATAWTFLPGAVRAGAEGRVPEPTVWLGTLVQQQSSAGFPLAQDVLVLRLGTAAAVVVRATRSVAAVPGATVAAQRARMARTPWLVEQVTFALGGPDVQRARLAAGS